MRSLKAYLRLVPIAACCLLCGWFTWFPLTDSDIWWHLNAGREMCARKLWLYTDAFSFTTSGRPWIDLQWLFQLMVYGLYCWGGAMAIVVAKCGAVAGIAALICSVRAEPRYRLIAALTCAMLFFPCRYLFLERPIIITIAIMTGYILCLERFRQDHRGRWLLPIIPLQVVWVNSQGLFALGIFIIAAYWLEALIRPKLATPTRPLNPPQGDFQGTRSNRARPPTGDLGGAQWFQAHQMQLFTILLFNAMAAAFINPYGLNGALLPLKLYGRIHPALGNLYSLNVAENAPLLTLTGFDARYPAIVIGVAMFALCLQFLNWRRFRIAHLILNLGFLYLAFCAQRNILLYIIAAAPIIAVNLSQAELRMNYPPAWVQTIRSVSWIGAMLALAIPAYLHARITALYPKHEWISPFRFPESAATYLRQNPIKGRMFNASWYGGYLGWRLYPDQQVFMDGRFILRAPEVFARYLAVCDTPAAFAALAQQYSITHAVLPTAIFTRYERLIEWLNRSAQWQLAYTDGASVIFAQREYAPTPRIDPANPATVDSIAETLGTRWRDDPYIRAEALWYLQRLMIKLTSASR
jgi:hypothetical protein